MSISTVLEQRNLISGEKLKSIFDELYSDILTFDISSSSGFISSMWARYESGENSLNGKVFEGLLACLLYRKKILPIFVQAKLAFVPNVDFDFVTHTKEFGPIVLSAKTSLRERYKQADLEGMMLRQVHRKSKSYLLTLDIPAANTVNKKIQKGEVLGLDDVIVATSRRFDDLIRELTSYNYDQPAKVDVINSTKVIV